MTPPRDLTAMAAGEPEQSRRPSFSKFWKRTKQAFHGNRADNRVENRIEFVQPGKQSRDVVKQSSESPGAGSESSPAKPLTASEKAKLRRAQVRRAQIQHRQRKAEYIKKLELDVTHFRELIALAQGEVSNLEKEKEAMRAQARLFGITISMTALEKRPLTVPMDGVEEQIDRFLSQNQEMAVLENPQGLSQVDGSVQEPSESTDMFGDIDIDDIIVSLKNDDQLATPVFSIRSNISSSSFSNQASSVATSPPMSEGGYILSPAQEQMAVNFILSLEHCCWDHFWLGDFPGHEHQSERYMGHTLMASTICMANAPETFFRGRKIIGNPPDCEESRARFAEHAMNQVVPTISYEWSAPHISLASLHDLASSFNPGDKELTPIQAWFELADRYSLDVLLDPQLLRALSQELNGVVKCLFFGAVMEREAFESVVCRLLGPNLDQMMADTIIEQ